jgi:hypothetical protein
MQSSTARLASPSDALWYVVAPCLLGIALAACDPKPIPGVPPDFQRRGPPPMDGAVVVVCDASGPTQPTDAFVGVDAQVANDASFFDSAFTPDAGVGCAITGCLSGLVCCPFDGRCNPAGCASCCPLMPDGSFLPM